MKKATKKKTVPRKKLSTLSMVAGGEKKYSKVIVDGEVKQWVGFGWVSEGKPTKKQEKELPHCVD